MDKNRAEIRALQADLEIAQGNTDAAIEDYNNVLADLEKLAVVAWEFFGWVITRSTTMPIQRIQKQVEPLGEVLCQEGIQTALHHAMARK